jgi:hypothetical protein
MLKITLRGNPLELSVQPDFVHSSVAAVNVE